jgi:hypothetical protein
MEVAAYRTEAFQNDKFPCETMARKTHREEEPIELRELIKVASATKVDSFGKRVYESDVTFSGWLPARAYAKELTRQRVPI